MSDELEPIDKNVCQAEMRGGSFMTFGSRRLVRCTNVPSWIGVAVKDGEFYGAMSLCDECKKACEIKVPDAKFQMLR